MFYYTYFPTEKQKLAQVKYDLWEDPQDVSRIVEEIEKDRVYRRTRTVVFDSYEAFPASAIARAENITNIISALTLSISNYLSTHTLNYTQFHIPKASGGVRTINAPDEELKDYMRKIKTEFEYNLRVLYHNSAYAYIKHRSIKTALQQHQKNDSHWFLKIDLKNFFPSTTPEFIQQQLRKLYPFCMVPEEILDPFLDKLTQLTTLDGGLPQGTPLSPLLTNLIMIPIDHAINRLANKWEHKMIYTRYADDLLFSCYHTIDTHLFIAELEQILRDTPYEIKREKTRYGSRAGRNWNLGLMLNKDNEITLGHKRKKRLKSMLYNFLKDPESWDLESCQILKGHLAYLGQIEPDAAKELDLHYQSYYHTPKLPSDLVIDRIKTLTQGA